VARHDVRNLIYRYNKTCRVMDVSLTKRETERDTRCGERKENKIERT